VVLTVFYDGEFLAFFPPRVYPQNMMRFQKRLRGAGLGILSIAVGLQASLGHAIQTEKIYTVSTHKTGSFIHDGLLVGGDQNRAPSVVVKDVRRSTHPGFERIVLDLDEGRPTATRSLDRLPYFQVAAQLNEKRVVITLWGDPKLGFDSQKVKAAFAKSAVVQEIDLMPRVEEENWTFALNLKKAQGIEVFELAHPARLIIDLKP
jgi:hypothetical protein